VVDTEPGPATRETPMDTKVHALMPGLRSDLDHLVRIPSISASNFPKETHPPLLEAYEAVVELCRDAGVQVLDPLKLPATAPVVMGGDPGP
jgi:cysteinylglycine-S-conjugate dipeptidase